MSVPRVLAPAALAALLLAAAPALAQHRHVAVSGGGHRVAVAGGVHHASVAPRPLGAVYYHAGHYHPGLSNLGYFPRSPYVGFYPQYPSVGHYPYYPSLGYYTLSVYYSYNYAYTPGLTAYVPPVVTPSYYYDPVVPTLTPTPAPENVARLRVLLPADAALWIDGAPTTLTGAERLFVSPPLSAGVSYAYELRARWSEGGRVVERERRVPVRAGDLTTVDFTAPAP
jgi:uncharacterized protein (TIGR03000 family)